MRQYYPNELSVLWTLHESRYSHGPPSRDIFLHVMASDLNASQ